jgi:hypothetical protein
MVALANAVYPRSRMAAVADSVHMRGHLCRVNSKVRSVIVLCIAPLATLGGQGIELSIKPESVLAMVRAVRRELAPMTAVRSQMLAAVRADSGTSRADEAFLRFDAAGADTLRAHLRNLKFALDPIALWPDSSALAPLRKTFASYGVWLEIAEADANPVMSESASRAGVGRFLTRPMRALLDIRVKEQLEPIGGDGAIGVPLDEIGRRIAATDRVRAMSTTFAGSEELERRRGAYLNAFLGGWEIGPFGDDGVLVADVRSSLERFQAAHPRTDSGRIVGQYLALLRSTNWRRTAAVDAFVQHLMP